MSGYTEDYLANKLTEKLNAAFVVSELKKKNFKSGTNMFFFSIKRNLS